MRINFSVAGLSIQHVKIIQEDPGGRDLHFYNWYESYIKMLHVLLKQIASAGFQCLDIEFWTAC